MKPFRALLIVNPVAGKTKGKSALFTLVNGLCRQGYQTTAYTTSARNEAFEITKELADAHDLVICCGGDGTLNEVINGLLTCKKKVPLGYIPAGSTNDFANTLQLKTQPAAALRAVLEGEDKPVDVGLFNDSRHFAYIASFGAFTAASYKAPQATKNALGHLAYILEGSKELFSLQAYPLTVQTETAEYRGEYVFGAVCNSTSVAGLVKLHADMVDMTDGLFEVVLVRRPKNAADLAKIITSLNTGVFDTEMFDFFKAKKVTFHMSTPLPWSLDGEFAQGDCTVTIENIPQSIIVRH